MSGSDSIQSTIDATRKILSQIKEDTGLTLELPEALNRDNLNKLESTWQSAEQTSAKLIIDASDVVEVDDDGLQAVVEIINRVKQDGTSITFDPPPSDAFLASAETAGVIAALGLD